jgi:hypothetical protein
MAEQSKSPIAKLRKKLLKKGASEDQIDSLMALPSELRDKILAGELPSFQDYAKAAKKEAPEPPAPEPAAATPRKGLPAKDAPLPEKRGVGFYRKKGDSFGRNQGETDAAFEARMAETGLPRGARTPKAGLSNFFYLQDRGNTPEEAQLKATLLESKGGTLAPDEFGNITVQKKGYRAAPQSSTGRNYDPVAERKNMMANAAAAVAERKNLQASDQKLAEMQEAKMRTPGRMSGLAGPSGFGQAKELTAQELLDRKPAMTPLSRKTGEMMPLRDELLLLNKEQTDPNRKGGPMPDSGYQERLDSADEKRKKLLSAQQSSKKSTPALTLPKTSL